MKKILVVDDDPSILILVSHRLKKEAVQLYTAANGTDALHLAKEHHPDVMVLDLMMPQMHGYTLIQEIRNDPDLSHTKILVTSAQTYSSDAERTKRLGADRYLSKPYDLQEFWNTISELLEEKRKALTVR